MLDEFPLLEKVPLLQADRGAAGRARGQRLRRRGSKLETINYAVADTGELWA